MTPAAEPAVAGAGDGPGPGTLRSTWGVILLDRLPTFLYH